MTSEKAQELAEALLKAHNLNGWRFQFSKAYRRFGICRYRKMTILLSKKLVELNDENIVKNTILHEIAHALAGKGNGHNEAWKYTAQSIGCDGQRCYDSQAVKTPKRPLLSTCPNGHTREVYRRRKVSCGKCSNVYDERFLLTYSNT